MRRKVYHMNWGLKGKVVPREWTSAALYAAGWYAPTPDLVSVPERAITETLRLIKGRSSYMFNRSRATRKIKPKLQWQRHYYCKRVKTWEYFHNARKYIESNRQHHNLPPLPNAPNNAHLIIANPTLHLGL